MQEKFNDLYNFLNHPKTCYIISKNIKEQINAVLCSLHDILIKNIQTCNVDLNSIISTLKFALEITAESNTKENFCNFLNDYCSIILDWNKTEKDKKVENLCNYLLRFSSDNFTVDEFENHFIEISRRLRHECDFKCVNFKLSEHYFNLINEE
jgi:hypothetical protein